jgi:hypothetical protein
MRGLGIPSKILTLGQCVEIHRSKVILVLATTWEGLKVTWRIG